MQIFHDNFIYYGGAEKISKFISKNLKFKIKTAIQINKKKLLKIFFIKFKNFLTCFYFLFIQNMINFFYPKKKVTIFSSNFSILGWFFLKKKIVYLHHLPKFAYHYYDEYNFVYKIFIYLYKNLYIYFVNNVDLIIFNSKYTKQNFLKYIKINKSIKNQIIYPYSEGNKKNYSKKKGSVICISRYSKYKNIDLLIQVAKMNAKFDFLLITSENIYDDYSKKELKNIKNLKIEHNVKNLKKYYESSLISIFLGEHEDYGMVVAESLSYNLPVIAINSGNISNMINHNVNGYLVSKSLLELNNLFKKLNYKEIYKMSKNISKTNYNFIYSKKTFREELIKAINLINIE